MTKLPYNRNFTIGRQSEQFMNDELHIVNEALKNINYRKNENKGVEPDSKVDGGLWLDKPDELLKYWDSKTRTWIPVFSKKFQIFDQMLNVYAPKNPVVGQLWLNCGILMYFDGARWIPVRTAKDENPQWSGAAFEDFLIVSPLSATGNAVIKITEKKVDDDSPEEKPNLEPGISSGIAKIDFTKDDWSYRNGGMYYFRIVGDITNVHVYRQTGVGIYEEIMCGVGIIDRKYAEIEVDMPFSGFATVNVMTEEENKGHIMTVAEPDKIVQETVGKDNHKNTNFIKPIDGKWGTENWKDPNIVRNSKEVVISKDVKYQYVVPSLHTDRIFLDHNFNENYEKVSTVCLQYSADDVFDKTVSAVHVNPASMIRIEKHLIKIDKLISTIEISAKDTEFYGFRKGEYWGDFLLESDSQDYGDYIPSGNHILLNYNTVQNYDYVLAVHYVFSWLNNAGSMAVFDADKKAYFLSNLQEAINVHADGLKLEETSYDIDFGNNTVVIEDDTEDVDIQIWTPLRKQFGYIRETDLDGNGYIKLQKKVAIPLVFVGGLLIHPLYGGLKFEDNKIIVPNIGGLDSMKNMPWCVVDLVNGNGDLMNKYQGRTVSDVEYVMSNQDYLDAENNYHMFGENSGLDEEGFLEYLLASGKLSSIKTTEKIYFDKNKIKPEDGILLFVEGIMINDEDIIRHDDEGYIEVLPGLEPDSEYVLLKDVKHSLYKSTELVPAFSTGYLNESLVYINGKLIVNDNCVATTEIPAYAQVNAINNEIKYFIPDNKDEEGTWKIYDEFNLEWEDLDPVNLRSVKLIASSYSNQLSSIKINAPYTKKDDIKIFAFHYSNAIPGVLKIGQARFKYYDVDDKPVYDVAQDSFEQGQKVLNLYRNGVKMVPNIEFREMERNSVKLFVPVEDTDIITYVIEPLENTEAYGHNTIVLDEKDALQPNVYTIGDAIDLPDLYSNRITVYINGVRLRKEDWILLSNRKIMVNRTDYLTVGSADNYPISTIMRDDKVLKLTNSVSDRLMIEIRKDFERHEDTIDIDGNTLEIYPEKYGISPEILATRDEIMFYLNGQFCALSRNKGVDYKIDKVKGCITILDAKFIQALREDPLAILFSSNALAYASWKKQTGKEKYIPAKLNKLTLVWRG